MLIKTERDLRCAYDLLAMLEERGGKLFGNHAKDLKRSIRAYQNRKDPNEGAMVIKDDGDAALSIQPLPEHLKTEEEADAFFMNHLYRECTPSMYDCTGQIFTIWYKIIRRQGRFWVYHRIGVDV